MIEYKNIILKGTERTLPYKSKPKIDNKNKYPQRDKDTHAIRILGQLEKSFEEDKAQKAVAIRNREGVYLEFSSAPSYELKTSSLENRKNDVSLLNIHYDQDTQTTRATVYIPKGREKYFLDKVNEYRTQLTKNNNPKNKDLISSIQDVKLAVLGSFWFGDKKDIPGKEKKWCEIWLRVSCKKDSICVDDVEKRFVDLCKELDISLREDRIAFPERLVKLLFVSNDDLEKLLLECDYIAEIRIAAEPTSFFLELDNIEQQSWVDDLLGRTTYKLVGTTICLLDTGINNKHKLLEKAPNDEHIQAVCIDWKTSDHDGHGTGMAGVALYNDLKKCLLEKSRIHISHEIESVKLLPEKGQNPVRLYGDLTKNAVLKDEIENPNAKRTVCMAITEQNNKVIDGSPSSWSGSIDDIASGASEENVKRLIVVSAGNVRLEEIEKTGYPEANLLHSVESPAQAWNAITVGAYSGVVEIKDKDMKGFSPISKTDELSPYSSTSLMWNRKWPIKPDVLFMGGNVASNGEDYSECPDLSLLTTNRQVTNRQFSSIWATSAATAQAAWFAAKISSEYPDLWPETIRALMIHSADWTPDMKSQFCNEDKKTTGRNRLLRTCGYGIPNLDKAIRCLKNSVNMIIEGELQPFHNKKMNEMHVHKIPWPNELLLSLGNIPVTLRVTLSYFIEPGPGEIGWKDKYRYASCGLRFDINKTNENLSEFEKRINAQMREDAKDIGYETSGSDRWYLGPKNRDVGSIHSDMMFDVNASDLCNCEYIAVFPTIGWWRERSYLGKSENKQRYSLVVSLCTPDITVDLYSAIQTKIRSKVRITV